MLAAPLMQDTSLVTSWNTENAGSATKTVVIPTSSSGSYGCTVDWGDGSTSNISTYNDSAWTHVYASTGTYTIKIYGKFASFFFNNTGDRLKILTLTKWGRLSFGGIAAIFRGCANLLITATDTPITGRAESFNQMFRGCTALTTIPNMGLWDISKVTSLTLMFQTCTNFNENISAWNTGSNTNLASTFVGCTMFNQAIGSWNTANVTDMSSCFSGATVFNQSLSSWNTEKVTTMATMFNNATAFNQDVSAWSIAALTNATNMFNSSGFDITNYDLLLDNTTGWPSQGTIQNSVTFSAGSAHYSAGAPTTGRAVLTGTYSWTITDGGTP